MASPTATSRRGNPAYRVKCALRAPITWRRRRAARDDPPRAIPFLDGFHPSRAASEIMALTAIDPHLNHWADLDEDSEVWDVGAAEGRGAAAISSSYGTPPSTCRSATSPQWSRSRVTIGSTC